MKSTNILVISNNPVIAYVLRQEGYNNLVEATEETGFQIAVENKPDLLLLGYRIFTSRHDDFVVLLEKRPLIRLIIVDYLFEYNSHRLESIIQAGALDCIFSFPEKIAKSVKKVLSSENKNPINTLPLVGKMARRIKQLEEENREIYDRMHWYENNQGKQICNCSELKSNKLSQKEKPKSTTFRQLGRVSDGYYDGYAYSCDVCKTFWVLWDTSTDQQNLSHWKVESRREFQLKQA